MPISRNKPSAGFTLLELVVVMVLLGLVTSMTLPAMQRWHEALQARSETSAIVEALQVAAFDAGVQRRDLRLDAQSFEPPPVAKAASENAAGANPPPPVERVQMNLPSGWRVGRTVPAVFGANGLCQPGLVALQSPRGTPFLFSIQGPVCRIEWVIDASAAAQSQRTP